MPPRENDTTAPYGDGCADDTNALQRLLDGGASTVRIPAGRYKISNALRIHSGTRLVADPAAIFVLADGAGTDGSVFLLTNADHSAGNDEICVEGGVWDSNCAQNPRGEEYAPEAYTGVGINFINTKHLTLRDLTVRNADAFFIRLGETTDFLIEDIRFDGSVIRPNQDGVHVGGFCERGVIRRLHAISPYTTNDDMVALNADDDVERQFNRGIKTGPIRDIRIEDIYAQSAYTFVRLLSQHNPIERVDVRRLVGGARCNLLNMGRWRFPAGNGSIRDVTVRDCRVRKMAPGDFFGGGSRTESLITLQLKARNVLLENIEREPGDEIDAPTLTLDAATGDRAILRGLTPAQLSTLCDGVPPAAETCSTRCNSAGQTIHDATCQPQNRLCIQTGSIDTFSLNPEH